MTESVEPTEIQPVPQLRLSSRFPTNADRPLSAWNGLVVGWGDTTRVMASDLGDLALNVHHNALVVQGLSQTAGEKSTLAVESAEQAAADAQRLASLDALWLGALAADPATGRAGAPLVAGNAFVNMATGYIRAYTGAAWVQGISALAGVTSLDGQIGDLTLKTIGGQQLLGTGDISFSTFEIGDARQTVVAPSADWIKAGNIYLQSSFPELYALVGTQPNTLVLAAEAGFNAAAASRTGVAASNSGTVIAVGPSAPFITRRATAGAWSSPEHPALSSARLAEVGFGNGVFIAVAGGHGYTASTVALRSTDDGSTWEQRVLPSGTWYIVECDEESGYWLAIGSSQCAVSRDRGVTWTAATLPSGLSNKGAFALAPCGGGKFMLADGEAKLSNVWIATVTASAVTWSTVTCPTSAYYFGAGTQNGSLVIAGYANGTLWLCRTKDYGATFDAVEEHEAPAPTPRYVRLKCTDLLTIVVDNMGMTVVSLGAGAFQTKVAVSGFVGGEPRIAAIGATDCLMVCINANVMQRVSGIGYDRANQFYLPEPVRPKSPFQSWVKAK